MDESADHNVRPEPPRPTTLLAALVRRDGRVRISARELADARSGKLGMSMTETGDLVVTYVAETGSPLPSALARR